MSLNIKNEHVHDLARQAAGALGTSQTGAVEEALTRLLEQLGRDPAASRAAGRRRRLAALLHEIDAEVEATQAGAVASIDDLYDDETGLPR